MKTSKIILLITAILFLLMSNTLFAQEKIDKNDRFQLFNARYNSVMIQKSKTTVFDEKKLFKIDTKTGETWMLIDIFKEGRDIKYWKKIKEKK